MRIVVNHLTRMQQGYMCAAGIDLELLMTTGSRSSQSARLRLTDSVLGDLDLPVTDIRLYGTDHVTLDREAVARAAQRIELGAEIILSIGLTRPYTNTAHLAPVHWLQVNNVHFRDDPLWREAAG